MELAVLAEASGHLSAAQSAYLRATGVDPGNAAAQAGLGNLLYGENKLDAARQCHMAALAANPGFAPALQGLARVLTALGDPAAEAYRQAGFTGHALVQQRYRGQGTGIPLLLLVAARGGNIPTQHWIDTGIFAVTAVFADYHDPAVPLPPHALTLNAIGDADLCGTALASAERIVAGDPAPLIDHPARVRLTGRMDNARRLGAIPGVDRAAHRAADPLRKLGRHQPTVPDPTAVTGLSHRSALPPRRIPQSTRRRRCGHAGRGYCWPSSISTRADGTAWRAEYRVMFIDGVAYPLHLAISRGWKVHYFTASMAGDASFREEERRFLDDMPAVLGASGMAALDAIRHELDLDYAGVDFALSSDGSLVLFEANATMVINPPDPDPMWDYRRPTIDAALAAARGMLLLHAACSGGASRDGSAGAVI